MSGAPRLLAPLACAALLASCSLVKLSDDIVQGHCERDSDCDELNAGNFPDAPASDPCQRWQCNTDEKLCRYGALDADHDGQSPAEVMNDGKAVRCEKDVAKQDCADDEETIGSGFPELCDEQDNDCDGRSDEGALQASATRTVVFEASGETATAATDAAYARDPMSGAIALGYGLLQSASARPGASLLDPALADRSSASTLAVENIAMPLGEQVALAPLDGGRFAYAFVNKSGARRLVAGVLRSDASQLGVLEEIATMGVHCSPDESCADVLASGGRSVMSPALASEGDDVLLAYLRFDGKPADVACGDLIGGDASADVLANLLARPSSDERLHEQSANAVRLGASSDLAAPALLALPAIAELPASWLVGYPDADGDVVIANVRRDGKKISVLDPELIRIGGGMPRSALALALGPAQDGGQVIGIAHQRGCGSNARIVLDLRLLAADGGELAVSSVADAVAVGGASNESNPALTYSANRDGWLVTYRDLTGLRARVLGADGAAYGDQPYTLIKRVKPEDGDEVDILPLPLAAFDLGPDFATIAHVLRADEADSRAFEAVKLSCRAK